MPQAFIGVVSHKGSRFSHNQGNDGLAANLARGLEGGGVSVEVQISLEDRHDPLATPITQELIHSSVSAQLALEDRWSAYLRSPGLLGRVQSRARHKLRRLLWSWRYERSRTGDVGRKMLTRLINIELAHLNLLKAGIDSGAEWLLILEDDAHTPDLDDAVAGLLGLMRSCPADYVNVSESFAPGDLTIGSLLRGVEDQRWQGTRPRALMRAVRPVTNTVCAILYKRSFAVRLLQEFDRIPVTPVVPIDWKLNQALMDLLGAGEYVECWFVSPGPIVQGSMHAMEVAR